MLISLGLQRSGRCSERNDPLLGMDFTYDMIAKMGEKTYSGGNITAITERAGNSFISSSGYEGTYDAAEGAITMPDEYSGYRISSGFTASAKHLLFMLFYIPATIPTNGIIWGTGDATSVQSVPRTSLQVYTGGGLQWFLNEANGTEYLGDVNMGGWNVLAMDFQSTSVCKSYLNSTSAVTFNPRDNMLTQTHAWFGGGVFAENTALDGLSGAKYARLWGRAGISHGASGDASIASIMTHLAAQKGVNLS